MLLFLIVNLKWNCFSHFPTGIETLLHVHILAFVSRVALLIMWNPSKKLKKFKNFLIFYIVKSLFSSFMLNKNNIGHHVLLKVSTEFGLVNRRLPNATRETSPLSPS
jgi:hypothetical protein